MWGEPDRLCTHWLLFRGIVLLSGCPGIIHRHQWKSRIIPGCQSYFVWPVQIAMIVNVTVTYIELAVVLDMSATLYAMLAYSVCSIPKISNCLSQHHSHSCFLSLALSQHHAAYVPCLVSACHHAALQCSALSRLFDRSAPHVS